MAKKERKLLGEKLDFESRLTLAQLTRHPGWPILVKMMGEACRNANEEVIKLDPTLPRYPEILVGLQTSARAMNQFSADILDSMKVHYDSATREANAQQNGTPDPLDGLRFKGFKMPSPNTPPEGDKK